MAYDAGEPSDPDEPGDTLDTGANSAIIGTAFRATIPGEPQDAEPALFGAFDYTPDRDLVRVRMQLDTLPHRHDQLHWEFLDITQDGGTLAIIWDNQMASAPFTVGQ